MRVAGLVAAAGSSSRMGSCKALLPFSTGKLFVDRIVTSMFIADVDPVFVTVPPDDDAVLIRGVLSLVPAVCIDNDRPEAGLLGSVLCALERAPDAEAILVCPVDCPFSDATLMQAVIAALRVGVAAAPMVEGRRGHPVAFARPAFDLLWSCAESKSPGGMRSVLDALANDVIEVPWSDARVCDDVDTKEDYERLLGTTVRARSRR